MKYNKGFAPVLILVIVLGVLAVGGVAYFAGKSSAPKNEVSDNSNYFPTTEQNYNPSVTSNTNITPPVNTKPVSSITVLSPSASERISAGSSFLIKWNSTNVSNRVLITLHLSGIQQIIAPESETDVTVTNNGSFTWKVPKSFDELNSTPVDRDYVAYITIEDSQNKNIIGQSKNFTITPSTVTSNWKTYTSISGKYYFKYPSDWYVNSVDTSDPVTGKKSESVTITNRLIAQSEYSSDYLYKNDMLISIMFAYPPDGYSLRNYSVDKEGKNILVDGIPGIKGFIYGDSDTPTGAVYIFFDRKIYIMHYWPNSKLVSTFDQILSGFKFTK